jgi:hypothetical protein
MGPHTFMAKGHSRYYGLVRRPQVDKQLSVVYLTVIETRYRIRTIYRCGRGPHSTTWRAAGCRTTAQIMKLVITKLPPPSGQSSLPDTHIILSTLSLQAFSSAQRHIPVSLSSALCPRSTTVPPNNGLRLPTDALYTRRTKSSLSVYFLLYLHYVILPSLLLYVISLSLSLSLSLGNSRI